MPESEIGKVIEVFVSIKGGNKENPLEIRMDEEGIFDDKFYAKGVERSVLIASLYSYNLALENNIDVSKGSLGENILIDLNPYNLEAGSKLFIGEVVLEITKNCTICNSLGKVDENLPKILNKDRGIFAKVLKSGKIRKGDTVKF